MTLQILQRKKSNGFKSEALRGHITIIQTHNLPLDYPNTKNKAYKSIFHKKNYSNEQGRVSNSRKYGSEVIPIIEELTTSKLMGSS